MRRFTPYEINHLIRFGFDPEKESLRTEDEIPVEYITKKAVFRNLVYDVNSSVLIPRIETEKLIDFALAHLEKEIPENERIEFADIGTGSGCIGISFAHELYMRSINFSGFLSDFKDQSVFTSYKNALQIFKDLEVEINLNSSFVQKNLNESALFFFKSDLLKQYPKVSLDLIISNLPYIPSERIANLQSSVKDFEPHSALEGGEDGLFFIRELLNSAKKFLKKKGVVILEVDDSHTNFFEFEKDWEIKLLKDDSQKFRYWICIRKY